jgi:hypothetical protein
VVGGGGERGTCGRAESDQRRLKSENMIDGLHILIWKRTKKDLAIALSGVGRDLKKRDSGDDLTNVQYKPIWNFHNESPLCNEYVLIKKIFLKKKPSNKYWWGVGKKEPLYAVGGNIN